MPVHWVSHTQRFFNCTHLQSHSSHSHRRCLSGEVSGMSGHFFKAPAVLPLCRIMIHFSTTSPRKSPFSFCSLYFAVPLRRENWEKWPDCVGLPSVDMSNSIPVVKLTIFPKRIRCFDMSNSLPVVKLSARPRNSPEPLNQMWCVESILLVGYFTFFVFVELNSPSHSVVMNKLPHPPQLWHPGWWWPSSRSSSCYRWLFSSCFCCKDKLNFLSGKFSSGSCLFGTVCGRFLSMLLIKAYFLTPQ